MRFSVRVRVRVTVTVTVTVTVKVRVTEGKHDGGVVARARGMLAVLMMVPPPCASMWRPSS